MKKILHLLSVLILFCAAPARAEIDLCGFEFDVPAASFACVVTTMTRYGR